MVAILRNMRDPVGGVSWDSDDGALAVAHGKDRDIMGGPGKSLMDRAQDQPQAVRPERGTVSSVIRSGLDRWVLVANRHLNDEKRLVWREYADRNGPRHHVVLGDPDHAYAGLEEVFENAPQSLREIDESVRIRIR